MQIKLQALNISCISSAIPVNIFDLKSLSEDFGAESVNSIIKSTGISSVRVADQDKTSADYCLIAAKSILKKKGIAPESIDGLIYVSQTPDYLIPQNSFLLQNQLGMTRDAICFDLRIGCSGYIYGVYLASLLISSGSCKKVLVLAGDTSTKIIHPKDRSLRMVFGDAGTASLVESGTTDIWFEFNSNGARFKELFIPAGGSRIPLSDATKQEIIDKDGNYRTQENLFMDGMGIFNFAIVEVPKLVTSLISFSGIEISRIKTFAFHQANTFMVNYLARKLKLPADAVPLVVDGYGNTGPATIPLLLSVTGQERKEKDQLLFSMLVGFGIGLSWAGMLTDLSKTEFIQPSEV